MLMIRLKFSNAVTTKKIIDHKISKFEFFKRLPISRLVLFCPSPTFSDQSTEPFTS